MDFQLIVLMVHSLPTKFTLVIQLLMENHKLQIPVNEAHFLPLR
jgi:hypothetical protein